MLSLFYIFSLLFTFTYGNYVYFNTSASYLCSNSCYFNDSSIWQKGIAPAEDDYVYIDVTNLIYPIFIEIIDSPIDTLSELDLYGQVTLTLNGDALEFVNCTLDKGATLAVRGGSILTSGIAMEIGQDCNFQLFDSSFFEQGLSATFTSSNTSSVELHDESAVFLSSIEQAYFSGFFYVAANAQLNSNSVTFKDVSIVFEGSPLFENAANFDNVKAQFLGGFSSLAAIVCSDQTDITIFGSVDIAEISITGGSEVQIVNGTGSIVDLDGGGDPGTLVISSSSFSISSAEASSIEVSLRLLGNTSLSLQNIILDTPINFGNGYFNETPQIYFTFLEWVEVNSDYQIPGQIFISDAYFTCLGNLTLSGGIEAQGSVILVEWPIYTGEPIILDSSFSTNTSSTLNIISPASVSTPQIQIQNNSQLQTKGGVSIYGSVLNSGIFQVNPADTPGANQYVNIFGSYSQFEGGIYVAYLQHNLTNTVKVSDSVFIDGGTITYTFGGNFPKKAKYVALKAGHMEGQFTNNGSLHAYPPSNLLDLDNLEIEYDTNVVYLSIEGSDNIFDLLGLQWWIWAAILIAVVVILIVAIISVVIYVRKSRKRLEYQRIKTADPGTSSTDSVSTTIN